MHKAALLLRAALMPRGGRAPVLSQRKSWRPAGPAPVLVPCCALACPQEARSITVQCLGRTARIAPALPSRSGCLRAFGLQGFRARQLALISWPPWTLPPCAPHQQTIAGLFTSALRCGLPTCKLPIEWHASFTLSGMQASLQKWACKLPIKWHACFPSDDLKTFHQVRMQASYQKACKLPDK